MLHADTFSELCNLDKVKQIPKLEGLSPVYLASVKLAS